MTLGDGMHERRPWTRGAVQGCFLLGLCWLGGMFSTLLIQAILTHLSWR